MIFDRRDEPDEIPPEPPDGDFEPDEAYRDYLIRRAATVKRQRAIHVGILTVATIVLVALLVVPIDRKHRDPSESPLATFAATPISAPEPAIYAQVVERDLDQLAAIHDAQAASSAEETSAEPIDRIELDVMALRVYPMAVARDVWGRAIVDVLVDSEVPRLRHEAAGILAVFRYDEAIDPVYDAFVDGLTAGGDVVPYLRALHDMIARCEELPYWREALVHTILELLPSGDLTAVHWSAKVLVEVSRRSGRSFSHEAAMAFPRAPLQAVALARTSMDDERSISVLMAALEHSDPNVRRAAAQSFARTPLNSSRDSGPRSRVSVAGQAAEIDEKFLRILRAEMRVLCDEVGDWRDRDHLDPMRQIIRDLEEVLQPK